MNFEVKLASNGYILIEGADKSRAYSDDEIHIFRSKFELCEAIKSRIENRGMDEEEQCQNNLKDGMNHQFDAKRYLSQSLTKP